MEEPRLTDELLTQRGYKISDDKKFQKDFILNQVEHYTLSILQNHRGWEASLDMGNHSTGNSNKVFLSTDKNVSTAKDLISIENLIENKIHEFSGRKEEEKELRKLSWIVFSVLSIVIIISSVEIVSRNSLSTGIIWTCILSGILGSTTAALLSALQRKANGWEFKDGTKFPETGNEIDRFSKRMYTFFLFRPTLGILTGLLIYFGFTSGILGATSTYQSTMIFWSILSGLFAKTMIEKLSDLFKNLFGK